MKCNKSAIVLIVNQQQYKNKKNNICSFREGLGSCYKNVEIILIEWKLDPNYTPMYGKSYDDKQTYIDESIKNIQKKYKIIFVIDMLYQSRPDDLLTKFFENDDPTYMFFHNKLVCW